MEFICSNMEKKHAVLIFFVKGKIVMKLYSLRRSGKKVVLQFGDWETDETLFKQEILKLRKGWVVVDVGSEFGYYAIKAAQLVGKSGKVIAIEPHPMNYSVLKKNIFYYKLDNIISIPKAAGARKEVRRLFEAYDLGGSSILPPIRLRSVGKERFYKFVRLIQGDSIFAILRANLMKPASTYLVHVDTLENILNECNIPIVNLIKIDVEGAELEVLKGSLNLLEKHKPVLLIEVHHNELGRKSEEVYTILEQYGYDLIIERRSIKTLVVAHASKR
jgi:FkbM family methyltransferase